MDNEIVWLEILHTTDKELLLSRIDKLNQFCRKANIITKHQKFFLWECGKKQESDALGFIEGEDGSFSHNTDWGRWFNLDRLITK